MEKSVLAVLGTPVQEVSERFRAEGITFKVVNRELSEEEKESDFVFGFTDVAVLLRSFEFLKHPPVLWETANAVHVLELSCPVIYADAKRRDDGLVLFHAFDYEKAIPFVREDWKAPSELTVEKASPLQIGNGSRLSRALNCFLSTLPEFTVEAVLVSFASSVQRNRIDEFKAFASSNRLVTKENEEEFDAVLRETTVKILKACQDPDERFSLSEQDLKSFERVLLLLDLYGSLDLESYLDSESNINLQH